MKDSNERIIKLPGGRAVEMMEDTVNMTGRMERLTWYTQLNGTPGEERAKTLMNFDTRARKIEICETIIKHKMPKTLLASYQAAYVYNIKKNYFVIKILSLLIKGTFIKQSCNVLKMSSGLLK